METEQQKPNRAPRVVFFLSAASLFFIAVATGLMIWKIPPTNQPVFLHYNIYFGIDKTGPWWQLLLIPGSGLAFFFVNTAAIFLWKQMEALIKIMLSAMTLALELMCVVAVILVILLNR